MYKLLFGFPYPFTDWPNNQYLDMAITSSPSNDYVMQHDYVMQLPDFQEKRRRVGVACLHCRANKRRCSEGSPCRICSRKGLECVRQGKKKRSAGSHYH